MHKISVVKRCAFIYSFSLIFSMLVAYTAQAEDEFEFPFAMSKESKTIRVGVREDSTPFSYRKPTKNDADILEGYGGYIVEVCRAVLRQVVGSGVFGGYNVKPIKVTAKNRFDKLISGEVDMLCGPDSITTSRLYMYNVSHPVFLSGIAVAKLPISRLPRTDYCGPILGVLSGTTAQIAGVESVLSAKVFQRFAIPIEQYLTLSVDPVSATQSVSMTDKWRRFSSSLIRDAGEKRFSHGGKEVVNSKEIKTNECENGFTSGPVIVYNDHSDGISDLCDGNIFFYLGDVDIIKRLIPDRDKCDVEISRRTYTKEAYGIYFRKYFDSLNAPINTADGWDAILYSEFNNTLLTQMQDSENVLHHQYVSEFGDAKMASDLQSFFESFKYATNY